MKAILNGSLLERRELPILRSWPDDLLGLFGSIPPSCRVDTLGLEVIVNQGSEGLLVDLVSVHHVDSIIQSLAVGEGEGVALLGHLSESCLITHRESTSESPVLNVVRLRENL